MTPSQKVVQIQYKDSHGTRRYYPMNESAVLFARIANTKTLTRETIAIIKNLGYRIENVAESLDSILAAPDYTRQTNQVDNAAVDNFVNAMNGSE